MKEGKGTAIDGGATLSTLLPPPTNPLVCPLLTDLYQLTMAYAYYKNGQHEKDAVFELFFRKNPFKGEFTIYAGLEECLRYLAHFKFSDEHIEHLRKVIPEGDDGFFDYLRKLDCSKVRLYSVP